jgi:hypothetical protein
MGIKSAFRNAACALTGGARLPGPPSPVEALRPQILSLSRENTNARSMTISVNQKRKATVPRGAGVAATGIRRGARHWSEEHPCAPEVGILVHSIPPIGT